SLCYQRAGRADHGVDAQPSAGRYRERRVRDDGHARAADRSAISIWSPLASSPCNSNVVYSYPRGVVELNHTLMVWWSTLQEARGKVRKRARLPRFHNHQDTNLEAAWP